MKFIADDFDRSYTNDDSNHSVLLIREYSVIFM